jgi:hypothetical protein
VHFEALALCILVVLNQYYCHLGKLQNAICSLLTQLISVKYKDWLPDIVEPNFVPELIICYRFYAKKTVDGM